MKYSEIYNEYVGLLEELKRFNATKIPLCAAETYCSPFVKTALCSEFEGKYCMQNLNYDMDKDFVGSQYVHRLYDLLTRQCAKMFGCKYADARTLSGMNCLSVAISALLPEGGKVLLTSNDQGGHPSVPLLLGLYGIRFDVVPYDYENMDLDYSALNELLSSGQYNAVIIAQSDLLKPADASKIHADVDMIIYDATQTFGMIAAGIHENPLNAHENLILIGGTHKTLPGPTSGLIMINRQEWIEKIDSLISPSYLRNTQPNNIAGVLLALLEQEQSGREYQLNTIKNANLLAEYLDEAGFDVIKLPEGNYTSTHQIFISTSLEQKETIVKNAHRLGITLNGKEKRLFGGCGIRLGLQEVSRYGWGREEMQVLAKIFAELAKDKPDEKYISAVKSSLAPRKIATF